MIKLPKMVRIMWSLGSYLGTAVHRRQQGGRNAITAHANVKAPKNLDRQETHSSEFQFDVFLSYSRKDEEFAKKLEDALESYRLPKDIKTNLVSRKRLSVFRDKRDLVPTDGDYWKTMEGYLERSANLLIVCSPNARESEYVNHEINTFLRFHEAKRLIPVLLWGRPTNDADGGPEENAFPDALCGALAMPLAVEYTEFLRARGRINRGRYHDSWYTLLAKIFGAERAEIERQEARRQARSRWIFAAVSGVIIAFLSVALLLTVRSRQETVRQRDHARQLLYASDVNLSQRAFELGNVGMGRKLLEAYLNADQSSQEDLRGFEWYYLWRLYNGQLASFDGTTDIAFSRDGAAFATVTADALTIWEMASLRETASFKLSRPQSNSNADGPDAGGYSNSSIVFSPDGRTLAYGNNDSVMLLDINSGSWRKLPLPGKGQGRREFRDQEKSNLERWWEMAKGGMPRFSPDGKLLAVSYACGLVAVYDAQSLKRITRLGDGLPASACTDFITFSPDSRVLAYGNHYNVKLWDTRTGLDLGEPEMDDSLPDGVAQVESVTFSPDGKFLAIGDRSKQVVLWSITTRKVLARLKGHEGWVSALAFSPDGKILYSGGMDQIIKLWDFSSYQGDGKVSGEKIKVLATLKGHTASIRSITCSPVGSVTATISADGTAKLWGEAAGHDFDVVEGVDVVSPGANLITRYTIEMTRIVTTLFKLRGGKPAKLWTIDGGVHAVLSPDGKTLATSTFDVLGEGPSTIKLWDMNSRRKLVSLRAQTSERSPLFSPDGRLFSAIGPDGKSVILWDTVERKYLTPVRNDAILKDYLLSTDGKVIVTVDKGSLRVKSWRGAMQRQSSIFEGRAKRQAGPEREEAEEMTPILALSPDGKLLALADMEKIELWETGSTRELILLGKHAGVVTALAFSPNGRLVAAGDDVGVVKVWDAATYEELSTFRGHKDAVTVLAFSPDGRALASGGGPRDGAVKIYGIASMRELITLTHEPSPTSEIHAEQGGEDAIVELFFSTQDRSLITLSGNRILRIWRGAKDANAADTSR